MKEYKKKIICFLAIFLVGVFTISWVSALQNYDQRVYQIGPNTYSERISYSQNQCERGDYQYRPIQKPSTTHYEKIRYTHYGYEDTRKGFLGDYVKEYTAYVTNRGKTGRYFTVVFTLKDKHGYEFTESVTQYLRTGERKRFVYRDIQYEENEILRWSYKVIPQQY